MAFRSEQVRQSVQDFDFRRLFLEELGWDRQPRSETVEVEDRTYELEAVAEKSGLAVYVHRSAEIPPHDLCQKIDNRLRQRVHEHLLVFVDKARTRQVWQLIEREPGRAPATPDTPSAASRPASCWFRNSGPWRSAWMKIPRLLRSPDACAKRST